MDKSSFKRIRTLLIVGSMTFLVLFTFTVMHQNSINDLVEGVSNTNILFGRRRSRNNNVLKEEGTQQNVAEGGKDQIQKVTGSVVGKDQNGFPEFSKERAQTPTFSDIGSKNDSSSSATSIASDKLLDGLLVTTFDEGTCLSRFQSYLYRKPSPHKPSPYLISKLRNYEHLHRSCGPHTKSYDKIMGKRTTSSKIDAGEKCKYLVWTGSNGLGNRMITMAAAFLYAILTDRVLLVKFGADMSDLFCEPFPDSSWLLPRNFPYWKDQKHIETYENMLMNKRRYNAKELFPSFLILNLQHTHDGHNNFFHCDHSQDLLQRVPVLILLSDQYFVPSLFMIPSFRQDLSNMFPEKDTVFLHLGRYLFHPSNKAWEIISRYYKTHLAKADDRIGLQIRVFNTHKVQQQTIINEIIACSHKHKLLPKIAMQKSGTSPSKSHNSTAKAVLVASLYSEYGEKLRNMYLTKTTVTGEVISVYQPSHEEHQKLNDDMHNIKAWSEIYLLSLSDTLITSPKSTFGYVAHGLGGLKPWILKRAYGVTIPNPPCKRAKSMEPCFHYPPKYECSSNNTSVDFTSLFHQMQHCEDVSNGLMLVNDNR